MEVRYYANVASNTMNIDVGKIFKNMKDAMSEVPYPLFIKTAACAGDEYLEEAPSPQMLRQLEAELRAKLYGKRQSWQGAGQRRGGK